MQSKTDNEQESKLLEIATSMLDKGQQAPKGEELKMYHRWMT